MKYLIALVAIFLSFYNCKAQQCEIYDRTLFNILPDSFPDRINCLDSLGRKQGAWIEYKLLYNPTEKLDELGVGFYVPDYSFGYFENNRKVKRWKHIFNVHAISADEIIDYSYTKDSTVTIHSNQMGQLRSSLCVSTDSSTFLIVEAHQNAPVSIECNKADVCILRYKGEVLNFFTRKDMWAVFDKPYYWYKDKIEKIDDAERKRQTDFSTNSITR